MTKRIYSPLRMRRVAMKQIQDVVMCHPVILCKYVFRETKSRRHLTAKQSCPWTFHRCHLHMVLLLLVRIASESHHLIIYESLELIYMQQQNLSHFNTTISSFCQGWRWRRETLSIENLSTYNNLEISNGCDFI